MLSIIKKEGDTIKKINEKQKATVKKLIKIIVILAIVLVAFRMVEIYIKANYRFYTGVILDNSGDKIIIDSDELVNADYFDYDHYYMTKDGYGHKVKIGDSTYFTVKYIVHINKNTILKNMDGKNVAITDFHAGDRIKLLIRKNTKERYYFVVTEEFDNTIFIKKIKEGEI